MTNLFLKAGCLLLSSAISLYAVSQCQVEAPPLQKRIQNAALIVEGKVTAQSCFWDDAHRLIYTANTIELYKSYKGLPVGTTIELITLGGELEGKMLKAFPNLNLSVGDYGIFTCTPATIRNKRSALGQSLQFRGSEYNYSFLPAEPVTATIKDAGRSYSTTEFTDLVKKITGQSVKTIQPVFLTGKKENGILSTLLSFSPGTVTAGTGTTITINGTGFGVTAGTVFFRNSNTGGSSLVGTAASDIISWDDNTIVTRVPSGAGTGTFLVRDAALVNSPLSATPLTVTYNLANANSSRTYLIDDAQDGNGGYRFAFSNNTANSGVDITANAAAMLRIAEAANKWTSTVNYPIYAQSCNPSTTLQAPGADGTNIIAFDSDAWDLDVQASSSTLGVAYQYYSQCGASNWEVVDMDIIFRRNGNPNGIGGSVNWNFLNTAPAGGEIDFLSVATHEIGHTLQLGHIINPGSVMHYAISAGTTTRTLSPTVDIAGGNDVMTASKNYTPPFVNCAPVGEFMSSRQAADYLASADCGTLAIRLVSFDAQLLRENNALIQWEALGDAGDHFIVQRSADGSQFTDISTVAADPAVSKYTRTDAQLAPGDYFYRLQLIDADGTIKYSALKKISVAPGQRLMYITQAGNTVKLYLPSLAGNTPADIGLYNTEGRLLQKIRLLPGEQKTVATSSYSAGTYFIRAIINNKLVNEKLLIR